MTRAPKREGRRAASWRRALAALTPALAWTASGCAETQRADPQGSEKVYQLAAQLFQQGQRRPALEEGLHAVKLNPDNAEAHYLLGVIALANANDSEEMVERQDCLKGEQAELHRQDVDRAHHDAETAFRQVLSLKPDSSEAMNGLAVVDLHFHRWDGAIEHSLKALSSPTWGEPWLALANLGWAYLQKRDLPRAAKELRQAVFVNSKFCVGRYRLAKVYQEMKNLEGAGEELEKIAADPECNGQKGRAIQEAFQLLGLVSLERGARDRASFAFESCEKIAPRSCLAKECRLGVP